MFPSFPKVLAFALAMAPLCSFSRQRAVGETQHTTYFKNTDYELQVYHIHGELPGKTMMIVGGIHNEPGGYLTADLYVDMALQKGNLIVVPRANLPSVVTNNRWINGDMNRQFASQPPTSGNVTHEGKVVEVLKQWMRESDLLLNLHDGSGFYRPTWISDLKNPMRWGQSVIADDAQFLSPSNGNKITLKQRAMRVLERVNSQVPNPEHQFHFNDTRTGDFDSPHPEMRGSATYFGLTQLGIECYGIETSKEIEPIELKVKYHSLVINAFMNELGIIAQNPKIALDPPRLEYLLVSVNGDIPHGIPSGKTFHVRRGDQIRIEHIAANYERGMIADLLGVGGINDLHKTFTVDRRLTVKVKKDQFPCGEVFIEPHDSPSSLFPIQPMRVTEFLFTVDGKNIRVANGGILQLSPVQAIEIKDVTVSGVSSREVQLNFVGFVPPGESPNKGEDRNYPITKQSLITKFSSGGKGSKYYITATHKKRDLGRITVLYVP